MAMKFDQLYEVLTLNLLEISHPLIINILYMYMGNKATDTLVHVEFWLDLSHTAQPS